MPIIRKVHVTQERFEDAGKRDADGYYDYYYSGVIYRFVFPTRVLVARRYDDDFGEASFLRSESLPDGEKTLFTEIPYQDLEFREAVAFLRSSEEVEFIQVLLPRGYVQIDFTE
jgi:hypothetical protein